MMVNNRDARDVSMPIDEVTEFSKDEKGDEKGKTR